MPLKPFEPQHPTPFVMPRQVSSSMKQSIIKNAQLIDPPFPDQDPSTNSKETNAIDLAKPEVESIEQFSCPKLQLQILSDTKFEKKEHQSFQSSRSKLSKVMLYQDNS